MFADISWWFAHYGTPASYEFSTDNPLELLWPPWLHSLSPFYSFIQLLMGSDFDLLLLLICSLAPVYATGYFDFLPRLYIMTLNSVSSLDIIPEQRPYWTWLLCMSTWIFREYFKVTLSRIKLILFAPWTSPLPCFCQCQRCEHTSLS